MDWLRHKWVYWIRLVRFPSFLIYTDSLSNTFYLTASPETPMRPTACPGWCGSVDPAPAWKPKGHQFDSRLGHTPGLQARSPAGGASEATTHWCFSPSFSLPSPLPINKYILKKKKRTTACTVPARESSFPPQSPAQPHVSSMRTYRGSVSDVTLKSTHVSFTSWALITEFGSVYIHDRWVWREEDWLQITVWKDSINANP